MYGPDYYYGPPDPVIPFCECGESYEDCDGSCDEWSILQLVDPVTGERPQPMPLNEYQDYG